MVQGLKNDTVTCAARARPLKMKDLKWHPELGVSRKYKNIGYPHPHKSELGDGTHGAGPWRVILHSNSWPASYLICKNGYFTYM